MRAYVFHLDDGSTLYEWDYRFGISTDGWYFVSRSGASESGELPAEL